MGGICVYSNNKLKSQPLTPFNKIIPQLTIKRDVKRPLTFIETPETKTQTRLLTKKAMSAESIDNEWNISHENVRDIYDLVKTEGSGTFGKVFLAFRKNDSFEYPKKYAIKIIQNINKNKLLTRYSHIELEVMLKLDHPNVTRLHEIYINEEEISFVLDFYSGGDLLNYILSKNSYSELDIAKILNQILISTRYIHNLNICHRDIKLENFLYETKEINAYLKLIDFGFAGISNNDLVKPFRSIVGSRDYIAPEVIAKLNYNNECDLWSIGILFYILLFKKRPFLAVNDSEIFNEITNGVIDYNDDDDISDLAKDLLKKFLEKDPEKRINVDEALKHEFFNILNSRYQKSNIMSRLSDKLINITKNLENLNKFQKEIWKVYVNMFLDQNLKNEINEYFLELDSSGFGIDIQELQTLTGSLKEMKNLSYNEIRKINTKIMSFFNSKKFIKLCEFTIFCILNEKLELKSLVKLFNYLDCDKKGFINNDGFRKIMLRRGKKLQEHELELIFNNKNGDFKLFFCEFLKDLNLNSYKIEDIQSFCAHCNENLDENVNENLNLRYFA